MISPLLYLNPGFGLMSLVQGQLHVFNEYADERGWGRLLATWQMGERAGWIFIALVCAAAMILISIALLGLASLLIRRKPSKT